ncbi:MAG: hypothetical protein ACRDT4_14600 [Micromonosporaceae bacterium]
MKLTAYQKTRGVARLVAGLALAAVTLAGLAACGGAAGDAGAARDAVPGMELSAEEEALLDLGYDATEIAPGPASSASADGPKRDRHGHRKIGKRVLHGELVISTKKGPQTILLQRGTITAIDGDSMTVKSADGHTVTWTFAKNLRVIERRKTVNGDALKVGEKIGVVGGKTGDGGAARLILIDTA